ncbi:MAG TPA: HlyD family efflux transporter periplasmic adaptor subunit [Lacipirellulaceae bacterium]|nr:HlyD family efflux transporter periplasmic adaptor subunit [Lacipirellulaceae bacterium]
MKRFAFLTSLMTLIFVGVVSLGYADQNAVDLSAQLLQESDDEKKEEPKEAAAEKKDESTSSDDKPAEEKTEAEAEEKKDEKAAESASKEKEDAKTDEKAAAKSESKKRKTHKVEPKRLKVEVDLDGVFVASEMTEVPLRPEAWTDYEIEEVVEHGKKVREGEMLIKFDDEKLEEAIDDLELEQRLNELAIRKMEDELPRMEKTLKMNYELADRSNRQAQEDFERYQEIERPQTVKSAEFMVKYYNFSLDYEKDELEQLEKMYEADDLTEETEEIVLKRQRNSVEFAEYSLENAKLNRDETLNVRLPRYDIEIRESLERAEMALARAKLALSVDLNQARYELEQRKEARTKSLDRHAKLLEDRGLMEIKSPAEGIVFYGQCVNGRWSETPSLITKYKPHSNVSPSSILMTIVKERPVFITASLDEGKRPEVEDGQKASIALPAEGADRLDAKVKSISPIPVSQGKFEIEFELDQEDIPHWVVAGMSCKIEVKSYDKKDAITVPKAAVHDDEDDVNKKYVWLIADPKDEDAKPERRDVTLGKRSGDDIEIVKGLKAGDVVSLEDESEKAKEENSDKD